MRRLFTNTVVMTKVTITDFNVEVSVVDVITILCNLNLELL